MHIYVPSGKMIRYKLFLRFFTIKIERALRDFPFLFQHHIFLGKNERKRKKTKWQWLHIPTRTVSCPVTTRTVSEKFPGNFLKFPKTLRALLPLAHYRKGNFPRFEEAFRQKLHLRFVTRKWI